MRIAEQGWGFITAGFIVAGVGAWGALLWPVPGTLAAALGFGFAFFCLYFYRDPERPLPTDPKMLYSPGDGVVLSAAREGPEGVMTLRIFLSVFDVHIQRSPCAGVVSKVVAVPGSFRAAMKDEASANERCVMTVEPDGGREPLVVEQIAGFIARRIECWPKAGERVEMGARYGIIYFGSQAAVHFPASARVTVRVGDRVAGGITPIGEWIS